MLDEPAVSTSISTNSIAAIEAALAAYDGALLVVTHDRDFLAAAGIGEMHLGMGICACVPSPSREKVPGDGGADEGRAGGKCRGLPRGRGELSAAPHPTGLRPATFSRRGAKAGSATDQPVVQACRFNVTAVAAAFGGLTPAEP